MGVPWRPIIVAVPEMDSYQAQTGIGRVFRSLSERWGEQVHLVNAAFEAHRLPVLRNFPFGVRMPADADLLLLPRLTGARALRKTCGAPGLVIVHDIGIVDFPGDREGMDWLTYRAILQNVHGLRDAAQIATDSDFTRRRLIGYLPEVAERIAVVPAGVDELFLHYCRSQMAARQTIEDLLFQTPGSPLLIYVGSEIPRKNIRLLLRVFRRIKDRHPNAQLLKVGGPGHPRWRAQTLRIAEELSLRVGKDLLILEHIDDAALADAYRAADVFVSTSLYEGFGLPALEALAIGTPVVVSDRAAFPEVVGDAGWVVEPECERFVRAIDAALADPAREDRARRSKLRAALFTWQRAAERYLDIMRRVCS